MIRYRRRELGGSIRMSAIDVRAEQNLIRPWSAEAIFGHDTLTTDQAAIKLGRVFEAWQRSAQNHTVPFLGEWYHAVTTLYPGWINQHLGPREDGIEAFFILRDWKRVIREMMGL